LDDNDEPNRSSHRLAKKTLTEVTECRPDMTSAAEVVEVVQSPIANDDIDWVDFDDLDPGCLYNKVGKLSLNFTVQLRLLKTF